MPNDDVLKRWAGIICLIFVVVGAAGWYLTGNWVTSDLNQVSQDLANIANNPLKYLAHIGFDILYNLSVFLLGGLFYLIFNKTNRALALFGFLGFTCTGFLWLFMDMSSIAQYFLAVDYGNASGAAASTIARRAADLSLIYDYSTYITFVFYAMAFISFGILIIRHGVLHRALGWFAIAVGVIVTVDAFDGNLLGKYAFSITEVWFFVTGVCLVIRWLKERAQAIAKPDLRVS